MSRRVDCPLEGAGYFIAMPDRWTGKQWMRYAEYSDKLNKASETRKEKGELEIPKDFREHLALVATLEDWKLPGINGNLDAANFEAFDIQIVLWANTLIKNDLLTAFTVPKAWWSLLPSGSVETGEAKKANP